MAVIIGGGPKEGLVLPTVFEERRVTHRTGES